MSDTIGPAIPPVQSGPAGEPYDATPPGATQTRPGGHPDAPARRVGGLGRLLVAALLGGVVGGAAVGGGMVAYNAYLAPKPAARSVAPPATAQMTRVVSQEGQAIESVAAKVVPSVVNVAVTAVGSGPFGDVSSSGVGSGIIIRPDGYILTNNHVVEGATEIAVRLGTDDVKARVVGTDPSSDLAVIKVEKTGLPAATLGVSAALKVGQTVVAVGSPFGLDKTVTSGIISALHRSNLADGGLTAYTNLIQTDASINPGNSGGALVDLSGAVVGINTLIQSNSGQSAGIGFAIPIDYAKGIAEQLIAGKRVQHPFLGISGLTVDAAFAEQYKLTVTSGAIVQDVVAASPAEKAGLKVGDIIVSADGQPITTFEELLSAIRNSAIGKTLALEVVRDGKTVSLTATLGSDAPK
jgi:putative serine protease PepD